MQPLSSVKRNILHLKIFQKIKKTRRILRNNRYVSNCPNAPFQSDHIFAVLRDVRIGSSLSKRQPAVNVSHTLRIYVIIVVTKKKYMSRFLPLQFSKSQEKIDLYKKDIVSARRGC